jgi:hypothetical protein
VHGNRRRPGIGVFPDAARGDVDAEGQSTGDRTLAATDAMTREPIENLLRG